MPKKLSRGRQPPSVAAATRQPMARSCVRKNKDARHPQRETHDRSRCGSWRLTGVDSTLATLAGSSRGTCAMADERAVDWSLLLGGREVGDPVGFGRVGGDPSPF